VHLPLSHVSGARLVRSQGIIEWVNLGDDDKIVLVVGAVGTAVAKETAWPLMLTYCTDVHQVYLLSHHLALSKIRD
jgi:hypothetical protein